MSVARRLTITAATLAALAAIGLTRGGATQAAAPAARTVPLGTSAPLGRANPFKPLIVEDAALEGPDAAASGLPAPPGVPPGPPAVAVPSAPVAPTPAAIAYVAIAYDTEAGPTEGPIAAVRVGGRTRFVRVGDTVDGATLIDVASHQLTFRAPDGRTRIVPRASK